MLALEEGVENLRARTGPRVRLAMMLVSVQKRKDCKTYLQLYNMCIASSLYLSQRVFVLLFCDVSQGWFLSLPDSCRS